MEKSQIVASLRKSPDATTDGKKLIINLFDEFFNNHDMSAVDRYMHPDYIQHDFDVPPGIDGFKAYFTKVFEMFPKFHVNIIHIIEEGDMVAMHGYGVTDPGKIEVLVVDTDRIKDGLLYEHWGTVQPLPPEQFGNPNLI